MARRIELLLLALVSASALVAPIRRAVPRAALRSTPPESGVGTSTASPDAATDAGGDAVPASDAAAAPTLAEDATAAAVDAVAVADADAASADRRQRLHKIPRRRREQAQGLRGF